MYSVGGFAKGTSSPVGGYAKGTSSPSNPLPYPLRPPILRTKKTQPPLRHSLCILRVFCVFCLKGWLCVFKGKEKSKGFLFIFYVGGFAPLRPPILRTKKTQPPLRHSLCILRVFCVYSACILRVFCVYSACILRVLCVFQGKGGS